MLIPKYVLSPHARNKPIIATQIDRKMIATTISKFYSKRRSLPKEPKPKKINWLKQALERQKEIYKQIDLPKNYFKKFRNSINY
jgi:hypothetical protein